MKDALEQIRELAKPGQELNLSAAIDLICDIWNLAGRALQDPAPAEAGDRDAFAAHLAALLRRRYADVAETVTTSGCPLIRVTRGDSVYNCTVTRERKRQ